MGCRVVLADRDERFIERVRSAIGFESGHEITPVSSTATAQTMARREQADVILLGPSTPVEVALQFSLEVSTFAPGIAVLFVAQRITTDLLKAALRSGMRDVLSADEQTHVDMANAIRLACADVEARAVAAGISPEGPKDLAKVITVFSTKGGVGKSVVASNLAVTLAHELGKRVIIVDLDFESSDVGIMLNLKPVHTIVDAVSAGNRLDKEVLENLLSLHSSGVRALLAPARPEDAEIVSVAKIIQVIELLREMCDIVVIDTPPYLNENVLTAVEMSTVVLGVATMEMTSVKNIRLAIQKFRTLGYRDDLMRLVLNRSGSKVFLEVEDVEKALGMRTFAKIPSDRLVPRSVNMGIPVVIESPKSAVAKSIVELATRLLSEIDGE